MRMRIVIPLVVTLLAAILVLPTGAAPDSVYWFNGPVNWPTNWTPIPSLNDPPDGVNPEVDFVGDASDPGGYYAVDDQYVYFRVRVAVDAVTPPDFDLRTQDPTPPASWYNWTFRDNILIAISNDGRDGEPDWGFAWDTHPWPYANHALELKYLNPDALDPTWAWTQMDDIDGAETEKLPPDFMWDTNQGHLRTVDEQPTANLGLTTFIDYAVSWSFLASQYDWSPKLLKGQTWYVQFVSIQDQADHDVPQTDVAGGFSPASLIVDAWSEPLVMNPTGVTPVPTDTSTDTPVPTDTPTETPVPTDTPTDTPVPTDTPTQTPAPTRTPTATPLPPTATPGATMTPRPGWAPFNLRDFITFFYPLGWQVTQAGRTTVLTGPYEGHDYTVRIERSALFTVPPGAETGQAGKVNYAVVEGVTAPGQACPTAQIYVWTTNPGGLPVYGMITITQAEPCDPAALSAFVDALINLMQ